MPLNLLYRYRLYLASSHSVWCTSDAHNEQIQNIRWLGEWTSTIYRPFTSLPNSKAHIPNIYALNSDTHTLRIQFEYTQKQCVGLTIEGMDIWNMGLMRYTGVFRDGSKIHWRRYHSREVICSIWYAYDFEMAQSQNGSKIYRSRAHKLKINHHLCLVLVYIPWI